MNTIIDLYTFLQFDERYQLAKNAIASQYEKYGYEVPKEYKPKETGIDNFYRIAEERRKEEQWKLYEKYDNFKKNSEIENLEKKLERLKKIDSLKAEIAKLEGDKQ